MATSIKQQVEFCAAYRLASPHYTDQENRAAYGPCFSENFHGHNFQLTVIVEGEVNPQSGMLVDYVLLSKIISEQVLDHVDHKNLNLDVEFLQGVLPTSENLCAAFWPRIAGQLPAGVSLKELWLQESRDNSVIYSGPK